MSNSIKRHFYNGTHYLLNKKTKRVQLLPAFHDQLQSKKLWNKFGFKKIGGSSVGDVLIVDNFSSQFAAFCRLSWIGLPILDRKYVDAGIAIEPKVLQVFQEKFKYSIQTFDPVAYNYDVFQDHDDVVGGIPDGYIEQISTILEVKTTNVKNLEKWEKFGIPESYKRQAQLYAHLMKAKVYSIVATFLHDEDYANPESYDIFNRKVKNWNFPLNQSVALDDIKKIKDWYQDVITSGLSPEYNEQKDADLIAWLECKNKTEWETLKKDWIEAGKIVN